MFHTFQCDWTPFSHDTSPSQAAVSPSQASAVPSANATLGVQWRHALLRSQDTLARQVSGKQQLNGLNGDQQASNIPSGYVKIAIENGHL